MKKMFIILLLPLFAKAQPQENVVVTTSVDSPSSILGRKLLSIASPPGIRFLRYNGDDVLFRTTAEVLSDIGAQSAISTGTTSQYLRGDLSLATFPTTTAAFTNSTNKNFVTDAQAVIIGNTSGTNTGDQTTITGNAGSATVLQTARNIQGVSFNGSASIDIINGTGFVKATGTTISYDNSTYQPLATNLTSIGALANGSGYLRNNGSGTFTYETPAGAGTVTNTGNLTANSVVLGNGTTDTKVVAGITTNGTAQLVLGVNTTTLGSVKMFGNTSGDVTIQPSAVAGTAVTFTLPSVSGTPLLNTTTSGVAATATASGTTTVTHNLGRIPTTIRIYSISSFTSNAAATPVPFSIGTWTSSGNRCVYMVINGTTTQVSQTSSVFSIIMVTSAGNRIEGVIGNVTSTGFDIVWTETGTHTAGNYMWEAQ